LSKEIIAKKAAIVEEVFEKFSNASSVVVVDYRGLTVDEVTELRKELREAGVEMRVIKNTFLQTRLVTKAWMKHSQVLRPLHSVLKMLLHLHASSPSLLKIMKH